MPPAKKNQASRPLPTRDANLSEPLLWPQEPPLCCVRLPVGRRLTLDSRIAGIEAKIIGIDTHKYIGVPLPAAGIPGLDIDLTGEMKRSGLSAV